MSDAYEGSNVRRVEAFAIQEFLNIFGRWAYSAPGYDETQVFKAFEAKIAFGDSYFHPASLESIEGNIDDS